MLSTVESVMAAIKYTRSDFYQNEKRIDTTRAHVEAYILTSAKKRKKGLLENWKNKMRILYTYGR